MHSPHSPQGSSLYAPFVGSSSIHALPPSLCSSSTNKNIPHLLCIILSKECVQYCDFFPPHLDISIPDFLGEGYKEEEDEESLEGHHDGVDVGQRDQLLHFHYQHSNYPRKPHHNHKRYQCLQPAPETLLAYLATRLSLTVLFPDSDGCHDEEPNINKDDHYDRSDEDPNEVSLWIQEAAKIDEKV